MWGIFGDDGVQFEYIEILIESEGVVGEVEDNKREEDSEMDRREDDN